MYVAIWIFLSGTVILYNKWILAYYGFPCALLPRLPCKSGTSRMFWLNLP